MHFHPDKCNLISITQKRKPIHFTYKLHDHPLDKVEHSKYLGITLQLKWNKHINAVYTRNITRDIRLHGGQMPCQIAVL